MTLTRKDALPGPVRAATTNGSTVWCAVGDQLLTFTESGAAIAQGRGAGNLRSLAAGDGRLLATTESAVMEWFEAGETMSRLPFSPVSDAVLAQGGGAVWLWDRAAGQARQLAPEIGSAAELAVPEADRIAPDGTQLWWTSRTDTLLRNGSATVDLQVASSARGGLVVCAGSVWCSVADGLLRVNAWSAELGQRMAAPEGPVDHLACAGGILVGGSGRQGLFVINPSTDVDIQHVDVDFGGPLEHLVATRSVVWGFAGGSEATLVAVRPGEELAD
jgi:hypothetical protein